ncbi:hypothetical protein NE237_022805 [Protea cynaroides]|uniref:Protein kinase domain-containing protein n=1 Tax=Protea cynaroides TaxID=273540 RepID=A0A9Q0K4J8_9MAGN|nr:hypothetical protein NE237_022805 [Protea cynaroides]
MEFLTMNDKRNIDAATDKLGRKKNIEQDYTLGSVIGQGGYGTVRLCMCKASGVKYACKTLSKENETVYQEVEIMRHPSDGHPGIVNLEAVYEEFYSFHLVIELCSGGDLLDHINNTGCPFSQHQSANILKQLVSVIKYCHQKGVVHGDIKLDNILLTLADFGLAVRFSNGINFIQLNFKCIKRTSMDFVLHRPDLHEALIEDVIPIQKLARNSWPETAVSHQLNDVPREESESYRITIGPFHDDLFFF